MAPPPAQGAGGRPEGRARGHDIVHDQDRAPGDAGAPLWMNRDGAGQIAETLVAVQPALACRAAMADQRIRAMFDAGLPRQFRRKERGLVVAPPGKA